MEEKRAIAEKAEVRRSEVLVFMCVQRLTIDIEFRCMKDRKVFQTAAPQNICNFPAADVFSGNMKRFLYSAVLLAALPGFVSSGLAAKHQPGKAKSATAIEARILKKSDSNGDGVIEKAEFKGKPRKFKRMDANQDGRVDGTELHAFAEKKAQRHGGKHHRAS
jgi:EF hand